MNISRGVIGPQDTSDQILGGDHGIDILVDIENATDRYANGFLCGAGDDTMTGAWTCWMLVRALIL